MTSVEGGWPDTPPTHPSAQLRIGLVVELCGLPGSGKTTLAARLAAQLRSQGVDAIVADRRLSAAAPAFQRLLGKALSAITALCSSPRQEIRVARVLGSGQANLRDSLAMPVLWWARKRVLARGRRCSGIAIVEEGLVQTLWSAGLARGVPPAMLVGLAESAKLPDVVVHVDVSPRLAVGRLMSRPSKHSRLQRLETNDQLPAMRHGDALLRGLLGGWRSQNLSDIIVVDGTDPDSVAKLADELATRRSASSR